MTDLREAAIREAWRNGAEMSNEDGNWLLAELAAAREREQTLREALTAIERMTGAAGYGEVPANVIRQRARAALDAAGGHE